MLRRLTVLALVVAASGLTARVSADVGTGAGTEAGAESNTDAATITATAGEEVVSGSPSSDSGPICEWVPYTGGLTTEGGTHPSAPTREGANGVETLYLRICPDQEPALLWVPTVSVEELVDRAYERVTDSVPAPVLEMNPEPSVGGIVNIGLWLAVASPDPVPVTASVGGTWATVTAVLDRTVWEMGNGDTVECDGAGVPIEDLNTAEQGPCGYTYGWPSAPEFTGTDDLAYHASVTGYWVVTFVTSTGRSGSLDLIGQTTVFEYQVREIQTVGAG